MTDKIRLKAWRFVFASWVAMRLDVAGRAPQLRAWLDNYGHPASSATAENLYNSGLGAKEARKRGRNS